MFPIVILASPQKYVILSCTHSAPGEYQKRHDFGRVPLSAPNEAQKTSDFSRVPNSSPGEGQKSVILDMFPIVRLYGHEMVIMWRVCGG